MSEREITFRAQFLHWLLAWDRHLPDPLLAEAVDHLARTDGQRLTLCFDGPLREGLFARLQAWMAQQSPRRQAEMEPALRELVTLGCHTQAETWNDVPEGPSLGQRHRRQAETREATRPSVTPTVPAVGRQGELFA